MMEACTTKPTVMSEMERRLDNLVTQSLGNRRRLEALLERLTGEAAHEPPINKLASTPDALIKKMGDHLTALGFTQDAVSDLCARLEDLI